MIIPCRSAEMNRWNYSRACDVRPSSIHPASHASDRQVCLCKPVQACAEPCSRLCLARSSCCVRLKRLLSAWRDLITDHRLRPQKLPIASTCLGQAAGGEKLSSSAPLDRPVPSHRMRSTVLPLQPRYVCICCAGLHPRSALHMMLLLCHIGRKADVTGLAAISSTTRQREGGFRRFILCPDAATLPSLVSLSAEDWRVEMLIISTRQISL